MQEAIICTRWLTFPQSLLPLSTAWGFESDMISVWHSEQSSATVIKHLGHSTLSLDKVGGGVDCEEEDRGGVDKDGQATNLANDAEKNSHIYI